MTWRGPRAVEPWRVLRTLGVSLFPVALALSLLPTASAHAGTTHAGTPHWLLAVLVFAGLGLGGASVAAVHRGRLSGRRGTLGVFVGALAVMFGGIGLVEIQVVAPTGPRFGAVYEPLSLLVGSLFMLGGLVVGWFRWRERPRYTALSTLLGAWIVYPVTLPNDGVSNPAGALLVVALPLVVAHIVRRDAMVVVRRLRENRAARLAGVVAALCFVVFLAFSAGTLSLNPDLARGAPTTRTLTAVRLANPLVMWPAIEFYFPSVPLSGFVSVGTAVLFGTMGTLVGLNVASVTDLWERSEDAPSSYSFTGSLVASGATACCCCAPAMYGVLSGVFGAAVTPIYWSFMDPTSPVGGTFLAASVSLLVAGLVANAADADACAVAPDARAA